MVGVAGATVVAVLTRAPSSGGKSRLFAGLGRAPDAALLAALLLDTLDAIAPAGATRVVAVEPAHACEEVRALVPKDVSVFAQEDGGLGDRMRSVMATLFAQGAGAAALVGSDLPGIRWNVVSEAFAALDRDPDVLVLGPAGDGGYYLIGATSVPQVFDDIEWGTERVLAQTMAAAARRRLRVVLLAPMDDVDSVDDLQRLVDTASDVVEASARTRAWAGANGIVSRRGKVTSAGA